MLFSLACLNLPSGYSSYASAVLCFPWIHLGLLTAQPSPHLRLPHCSASQDLPTIRFKIPPSCARTPIRPNSWGQGQQPGMCSSHQEEMGRPGDRNTERRASADPAEGMRTPGGFQAQGSDPAKEMGFLKAKSLPRRFPGRNTRMLMMKDPTQYSPRFRYLFLGG